MATATKTRARRNGKVANGKAAATRAKAAASGKAAAEAAAIEHDAPSIEIDRIAQQTLLVPIIGTTPLLTNRFSEKAKRQMLHAAQGKRTPREPKDPQAEYEAAFYRIEGQKRGRRKATPRFGFPADAFKKATVSAARFYGKAVSMTSIKQFVFVHGIPSVAEGRALVEIEGDAHMREDVARVGRGGTELRYRPEFWPWQAELTVTYFASVITKESVLSLIDAGGMAVGVGDWRPERDGTFGTYTIDQDRKIESING
jgi:hypothetical protein